MVGGFGPDGLQPPSRRESVKKSLTWMGGVSHNPTCTPQSPGAEVLKGWKVAANHPLSRVYNMLWQQHTRRWSRRWGWTWWWQWRSAPSSSLAGWTSSAATGRTSSVVLFWCSAPILGPGWWWCPGSRLGSHTHLHCLYSIKLQVVLAAPGHQMVNLPPVGGLIPARDELN